MGIGKKLGDAFRDQLVGMVKYGASTSYSHNKAAMDAAREERESREAAAAHAGGWLKSEHGSIDGRPVTFSLGWGTREGETLLADGHLSEREFKQSANHDHYGKGTGPHNNGTLRNRYTGPGA